MLLGLLNGSISVNRHAAHRAVAHHRHDTNDKRPLLAEANTLGVRERVPTNYARRDNDEVN
jgi:hypothetical protein